MTFEDLKGFRSIQSKLTGHGESHLNPEGVLLSNGPLGSALPQAQGLALADNVLKNDRVTICTVSDGASMEGEAKEAFAAIPGLAAKGLLNPSSWSFRTTTPSFPAASPKTPSACTPTFEAMSALGWNVIQVADGNDLATVYLAVERGLQQARANPRAPVCLWVKTIKGFGVKLHDGKRLRRPRFSAGQRRENRRVCQRDLFRRAKFPPNWPLGPRALRADWEKKEAAKKAKAAVRPVRARGQDGKNPGRPGQRRRARRAGGISRLFDFRRRGRVHRHAASSRKAFPDRFCEVGVAEANMISTGAGLAKAGLDSNC